MKNPGDKSSRKVSVDPTATAPGMSPGSFCLGREKDNMSLEMSEEDMRKHTLIIGGNGYGKKELSHAFLQNAIASGHGVLNLVFDGDLGAVAKVMASSEGASRKEDVINLSFLPRADQSKNTDVASFNPFNRIDADTAVEIILPESIFDEKAESAGGWGQRSIEMHRAVLSGLFWLRDNASLYVDAKVIKDHLSLDAVVELSKRVEIPEQYLTDLKEYVRVILGLGEEAGPKHHGYFQMLSLKNLDFMINEYPEVFVTGASDVDFVEIITKSKILNVIFSSVHKSKESVHFLSSTVLKCFVSAIRALDTEAERDIKRGFVVLNSDVELTLIPEIVLLSRQSRKYGIALVSASSDPTNLVEASPEIADSIIANTNTKIFMRNESRGEQRSIDCIVSGVSERDVNSLGMSEAIVCRGGKSPVSILLSSVP